VITAHLPSGYVLGEGSGWTGPVMVAALVGAIFPDLDLIAFYFIDDRAMHHHRYWVHAPAFAALCSAALIGLTSVIAAHLRPLAIAFSAAWMVHIGLDSVAGGIMWLWPYSNQLISVFTVPPRDGVPWIVAFLTHWTIVFEALIWATALFLWIRRRAHG
jgi:inner membrane protein